MPQVYLVIMFGMNKYSSLGDFVFRTYTAQIIEVFLKAQSSPTTVTVRVSRKETSTTLMPVSQVCFTVHRVFKYHVNADLGSECLQLTIWLTWLELLCLRTYHLIPNTSRSVLSYMLRKN